jgi:pimeloyl-ACP methyl ester carboxylesterase
LIHKLPDGRDLAFSEYGDLYGTPVFFFHGMPGSRLFRPPEDVTQRLGVRFICVDRPGYGCSTFQPNRRILDWANDISSLADALDLDRFAVSGHSGGGPHTLACAYGLPNRVTAAAILSGAAPVAAPNILEGITPLHKFGLTYGKYIPWPLWRFVTWWLFRELAADPTKAIDNDRADRPWVDNELLDIPELRAICIQSDVEAYQQGLLAFSWESHLFTRPWGFPLEKIEVPVYVWHGTQDNSTTMAMARYLERTIPHCKATFCEGEAHMLLIPHWEEILTMLIRTPVAV